MSRGLRVVLVWLVSILAGLGVAAGLSMIETLTGVALYRVSAAVVIPVGAVGCGFVAAIGFQQALKAMHVRPAGFVLGTPLVTAVVAFVAAHWFTFIRQPLPEQVGFVDYLRMTATESAISLDGAETASRLGNWGYAVVALEILGFAAGSWFVTHDLARAPWCGRCGLFMQRKGRRGKHFDDGAEFEETANRLVDLVEYEAHHDAFDRSPNERASLKARRRSPLRLTTEIYRCPSCERAHTIVSTHHQVNQSWQLLSETERQPDAPDTDVVPGADATLVS